MFTKTGGEFFDCHPVTGIEPGDVVTVKSNKGDIKAKKVLITVGECCDGQTKLCTYTVCKITFETWSDVLSGYV